MLSALADGLASRLAATQRPPRQADKDDVSSSPVLLVAESDEGIHAGGAARGEPACEQSSH